jgi:hypothetical protein
LGGFSTKKRGFFLVPGLTGPVVLVATSRAKRLPKRTIWCDILSLFVDIFCLRAWRDMDPLACVMLAGFTAIIAQPLVFGGLGSSVVALMTPTK